MSESSTDSTQPRTAPLVEVTLKARRSLTGVVLVIIAALVGVIAVSMAGIVVGVMNILAFTAIEVVFICSLVYLVERSSVARLGQRVEYLVNAHSHFPVTQLLERAFAEGSLVGPERRFGLMTRVLAAAGRVGETVRDCPTTDLTPIEPITVPFESCPLDEDDGSFAKLDGSLADQPDADLLEPEALEQLREQTSESARVEQKTRKGLGWLWAGLLVLPTTAGAMYAFSQGEITWPAIFVSVIVLSALIGWGQASGLLVSREWFVVPGGLVLREAGVTRTTWDLHLFERRKSVLIAHRADRNRWIIFVANTETDKRLTATRVETDFLLRAWLSPLPPPPLEQLTDLG